jgi:hypothetical protein
MKGDNSDSRSVQPIRILGRVIGNLFKNIVHGQRRLPMPRIAGKS